MTRNFRSVIESSDNVTRVENFQQPCQLIRQNSDQFFSDGTVIENGAFKVSINSGGTPTSDNVIAAICEREIQQREEAKKRTGQRTSEQRKVKRQEKQQKVEERRK